MRKLGHVSALEYRGGVACGGAASEVRKRTGVASIAFAVALAYSPAARADDERPVHTVGIGPVAGVYSGFGATAWLRAAPLGLQLSGGYMPLLIFGNDSSSKAFRVNYYSSAQLDADLTIGPVARQARVDLSLMVGYRYNSVLGHGAGAGVAIEIAIAERWGLTVLVGPSVFPSAQSRLDARDYPSDRDAALPWLQGGAGAALTFYP